MAGETEMKKVKKVFNSLTNEQKEVVFFIVGSLIEKDVDVARFLAMENLVLTRNVVAMED